MKSEKFERYIKSVIKEYQPILLLQRHTFEVSYDGSFSDNEIMESVVKYPYLNAKIKYGDEALRMWKNKTDMKPYIIHEMCHTITDPLYIKGNMRYVTITELNDERERLTDVICNIIINNKL